ncbi:MAG: hypothetical protein NC040_09715 [Muribaculaceae bacterium]|nr:hypothetical protein [Alistipes senegalensis]MCM1474326.1 hypothetical protein [Muribaculaceae bacterium]
MGYSGENKYFSFHDGFCETLPGVTVGSSETAVFGRIISKFFRRFSVGCDGFRNMHILYALCCGLSECGRDVYVCENTDLPSFRFGLSMLSADCGIFISGDGCLKMSFFGADGFPVLSSVMTEIMNASPANIVEKCGKIMSCTSFREIYINNLADTFSGTGSSIQAGISCGNRSVRSLWLEFFSGEDDNLVFQISDDGQRVNAYSTQAGFISHEKLILSYVMKLSAAGQAVYLPENFHYSADILTEKSPLKIKRFSSENPVPPEAVKQRFLTDPLYMCIHLADNKADFIRSVKSLPALASARREIFIENLENIPCGKTITETDGRVIISRSGKNRITLLAQSRTAETAAEICSDWCEKLRQTGSHH